MPLVLVSPPPAHIYQAFCIFLQNYCSFLWCCLQFPKYKDADTFYIWFKWHRFLVNALVWLSPWRPLASRQPTSIFFHPDPFHSTQLSSIFTNQTFCSQNHFICFTFFSYRLQFPNTIRYRYTTCFRHHVKNKPAAAGCSQLQSAAAASCSLQPPAAARPM